jgi:hypothetical protein
MCMYMCLFVCLSVFLYVCVRWFSSRIDIEVEETTDSIMGLPVLTQSHSLFQFGLSTFLFICLFGREYLSICFVCIDKSRERRPRHRQKGASHQELQANRQKWTDKLTESGSILQEKVMNRGIRAPPLFEFFLFFLSLSACSPEKYNETETERDKQTTGQKNQAGQKERPDRQNDMHQDRKTVRQRHRRTDEQAGREACRETGVCQTKRWTDKCTDSQKDRSTDRQTDRQTTRTSLLESIFFCC